MSKSIPIHPDIKYNGNSVNFEMYKGDNYARFHFSALSDHIHGYYLFIITNSGIKFDQEVHRNLGGVRLDLDSEKGDTLKVIGVDLV